MSFWTDVRDAATAPFRAVGSFVQDIASGENFFSSLGTFATREFFATSPTIALNSPIINNTPINDVLNNSYFNALTAGLGSNITGVSSFTQKANTGADFSFSEARDAYLDALKGTAKVGAAVLSGGAAPASASAYTVGAAAYGGAVGANSIINKVESGDVLGAISSTYNSYSGYTGMPEIPQDVKDAIQSGKDIYNTGNQIKDEAQKALDAANAARDAASAAAGSSQQAQGLVDLTKGNIPLISKGYSSTMPGGSGGSSASTLIPLIAGGAILGYILLKGKK